MVDLDDIIEDFSEPDIDSIDICNNEAPEHDQSLYSKRVIFWLSFLCSVVLGFILLFINLGKQKKKTEFIYVIGLFLVFVTVYFNLHSGWQPVSALSYWGLNLSGAIFMYCQCSWFIGNVKNKTRKLSNALLTIALLLFALRIFFTFTVERII